MPLAVLGLDIHAVEFIGVRFLIRFAFKKLDYLHILVQEHGDQPFENPEVAFIPEHMFHSPVKADICILLRHKYVISQFSTNIILFFYYNKYPSRSYLILLIPVTFI